MTNEVLEQEDGAIVEGLDGFKFVGDFDDEGDTVAVVSHPGWKTQLRIHDKRFKDICEAWMETHEEIPKNRGIFRALSLSLACAFSPSDYLNCRHAIYEVELFQFLSKNKIPTIVTIPVRLGDEEGIRFSKFLKEHKDKAEEEIDRDLDDLDLGDRLYLSSCMTSNFPRYLEEVRGDRDNFYLLPTGYNPRDEAKGLACGFLFGDYGYTSPDEEFVTGFLNAIRGKRVFVAGSDLSGCLDVTLSYLKFVECNGIVLANYCGVGRDDSRRMGTFEDPLDEKKLVDKIRMHPQETYIVEKMREIVRRSIKKVDDRVRSVKDYEVNGKSEITNFDGYVSQTLIEKDE